MRTMNSITTRTVNGGARRYYCPWNDYSSTSFWKTWGHAISCAYKHGYFDIPFTLIEMSTGKFKVR